MKRVHIWLVIFLLAATPIAADAQKPTRDALIVYRDGFTLKGRVNEKVGTIIYDRASGRSFALPSGEFFIDDHVRNILFTPGQIQKVIELKKDPGDKLPMAIKRFDWFQGKPIQASWIVQKSGEWDDKGERAVQMLAPKFGAIPMTQKVAFMTPNVMVGVTKVYEWEVWYFTQEFGPTRMRDMLFQIFAEKKELKGLSDAQKLLKIATFMQEAGWFAEAEKDLVRCVENFAGERKEAQDRLDKLKQVRTNLFVKSIEHASLVGQHEVAIDRLDTYDKLNHQALTSAELRLIAQDLKVKYDKTKTDIEQAKVHLKKLPPLTKTAKAWIKASSYIADELNHDTVGRLATFITFADQHEMDLKAKRKPGQSAEEVLAFAITGWLQGPQASEPDPVVAMKLARTRQYMLDYLANDDLRDRGNSLSTLKGDNELPADMLVQLVRKIPPSHAHDPKKCDTDTQTIKIDVPDGVGGSYLVKLPPDYHHLRSYPVLMVLHSGRGLEKPETMINRFADEAAKNGYILVAPFWSGNALNAKYGYTFKEHAIALDTLRDLRRRFQIDSDRVFLFGWDEGANMAFDVGLAHPDQFAGVMTMNGTLMPFTRTFYWPNAQYLPFYVIEGDRNVENAKRLRDLFKDWNREPYAATYVEYKGRGTEWYSAEVPIMMGWMKGKKRHYPLKEMGRANGGVKLGEEFHSTRASDNRFYWLSSDGIANARIADHRELKWLGRFQPATFQAEFSVGNLKDAKGGANIWNQVNLRVAGVNQVTMWFTPTMMDFKNPLILRVNGNEVGARRVISPSAETMLEELYQSGDRQRLLVAKIAVRVP